MVEGRFEGYRRKSQTMAQNFQIKTLEGVTFTQLHPFRDNDHDY